MILRMPKTRKPIGHRLNTQALRAPQEHERPALAHLVTFIAERHLDLQTPRDRAALAFVADITPSCTPEYLQQLAVALEGIAQQALILSGAARSAAFYKRTYNVPTEHVQKARLARSEKYQAYRKRLREAAAVTSAHA